MDGPEYPIAHFELLTEVAKRLKALSVQILVHEYHYRSFGSWWFTFMRCGETYRVLFDGKDSILYLEKDVGTKKVHGGFLTNWKGIASEEISERNGPTLGQISRLVQEVTH